MLDRCPSRAELVRYVDAVLDDELAVLITKHLDSCRQCEETVTDLEQNGHGVIRSAVTQTQSWMRHESPANDVLYSLRPDDEYGGCRLVEELGAGSFARVFLAQQTSMQRFVALKFSTRPGAEPTLLSRLTHPHIVRVYHNDSETYCDVGLHLMYMEYIPGCTLKDAIEFLHDQYADETLSGETLLRTIRTLGTDRSDMVPKRSSESPLAKLSWPEAVAWIGARLADALAFAHAQGIVHRDVKPANILLTPNGAPMLLDFNVGFGETIENANEQFGGSLPYMSPEQRGVFESRAEVAAVREPSDIYSLGVVLHELATGRRPNTAEAASEAGGPSPPSVNVGIQSEWPGTMVNALERCLAREPENRPANASDLARKLHLATMSSVNRLLCFRSGSWRDLASRAFPFAGACLMLSLAGLIPNLLTILLSSYCDNVIEILETSDLRNNKLIVNSIVLPIGFAALFGVSFPVMSGFAEASKGRTTTGWRGVFSRAALLPVWYAVITFAGWALNGGFIFPMLAWLSSSPGDLTLFQCLRYSAFHLLLGMVAAAVVYLTVGFVTSSLLLPKLINVPPSHELQKPLDRLRWGVDVQSAALGFFLPLALMVVVLGESEIKPNLLIVLGLVAVFVFGLAAVLATRIRRTVETLKTMLKPLQELIYGDERSA